MRRSMFGVLAVAVPTTTLSDANEVPGPGDARVSPMPRKICYEVNVQNIAPATMAHIHKKPRRATREASSGGSRRRPTAPRWVASGRAGP